MLAATFLLAQSTNDFARIQSWNPDPSILINLKPESTLTDNPELAKSLKLERILEDSETGNRITFMFTPRTGKTTLSQLISQTNQILIEAVPNKAAFQVEQTNLLKSLDQKNLPYQIYVYPNKYERRTLQESICESAAIFFQTGAGFWTLSTNGTAGNIDHIKQQIQVLFNDLKLERLDTPAIIKD